MDVIWVSPGSTPFGVLSRARHVDGSVAESHECGITRPPIGSMPDKEKASPAEPADPSTRAKMNKISTKDE